VNFPVAFTEYSRYTYVYTNTITEVIMPRKRYDEPHRIQVTVSDTLFATLFNHAHQLNLPISSYVNLILSGVVEWKYKIRAGEFNPDTRAVAAAAAEQDYGWGPGIPMTHAQYLLDGGQLGEGEWLLQGTPKGPRR